MRHQCRAHSLRLLAGLIGAETVSGQGVAQCDSAHHGNRPQLGAVGEYVSLPTGTLGMPSGGNLKVEIIIDADKSHGIRAHRREYSINRASGHNDMSHRSDGGPTYQRNPLEVCNPLGSPQLASGGEADLSTGARRSPCPK